MVYSRPTVDFYDKFLNYLYFKHNLFQKITKADLIKSDQILLTKW